MKPLQTRYTRRERVQDAIVDGMLWFMREVAWLLRMMGRRR